MSSEIPLNWAFLRTGRGITLSAAVVIQLCTIILIFRTLFLPLCYAHSFYYTQPGNDSDVVHLMDGANFEKYGYRLHYCAGDYLNFLYSELVAAWFFVDLVLFVLTGIILFLLLSKPEAELKTKEWKLTRFIFSISSGIVIVVVSALGFAPILRYHIELQFGLDCYRLTKEKPPRDSVSCGAPHFYEASFAFILCLLLGACHLQLFRIEVRKRNSTE